MIFFLLYVILTIIDLTMFPFKLFLGKLFLMCPIPLDFVLELSSALLQECALQEMELPSECLPFLFHAQLSASSSDVVVQFNESENTNKRKRFLCVGRSILLFQQFLWGLRWLSINSTCMGRENIITQYRKVQCDQKIRIHRCLGKKSG